MGLLDGVLGGIVGAEVTHLISGVIAQHGGVGGLVSAFEQKGMGGIVQSWVGTGANLPITAEQIQQVLGNQTVTQLAERFGMDPQVLAQKVAELLPKTVDQMTPNGVVPPNS